METKNLFGCTWSIERYYDDHPDLYNHNRVRLTCIESDNPVYPVGATISCADTSEASSLC